MASGKGGQLRSVGSPLDFFFNGRLVRGYQGDTIATALVREGLKVFSRSMTFHRPRGLYCGSGRCISCVMRVNGVPGVRTCAVPLESGMDVRTERGFPSSRFDILSVLDSIFRHEFEYQSRFIRPAFMTPLYQKVVRRLASSSRVPDVQGAFPPIMRKSCDLLIIGQGISGSVARARIQKSGMRSVIVADRLVGDGSSPPCTAFGFYESGEVGIQVGDGVLLVRAKSLLIAAGRSEIGLMIPNGDIPGNLLPEAVRQLTSRGIKPGDAAILVGENELADRVRRQLGAVGSMIVAELRDPSSVARVLGRKSVSGAEIREGTGTRKIACDLVVHLAPLVPAIELARQAGCSLRNTNGTLSVEVDADGRTTIPGIFACGGTTGLLSETERITSGERAAVSVLNSRGGA